MDNGTVTVDRELLDYLLVHLREVNYDGVDNYIRVKKSTLGLKRLPGVEPLMPGMGPVINDISWFEYPINISPCRFKESSLPTGNSSRSLFIGTISGPNNFERRAAIRRTWPGYFSNRTDFKNPLDLLGFGFVIGQTNDSVVQQKVKEESKKFGDILQINTIDRYVDLSVKVASLFNWVNRYCSKVDYLLKVDDDVYVNVHNLATVLHSLTVSDKSIYGRQCGGNIPERSAGQFFSIQMEFLNFFAM